MYKLPSSYQWLQNAPKNRLSLGSKTVIFFCKVTNRMRTRIQYKHRATFAKTRFRLHDILECQTSEDRGENEKLRNRTKKAKKWSTKSLQRSLNNEHLRSAVVCYE